MVALQAWVYPDQKNRVKQEAEKKKITDSQVVRDILDKNYSRKTPNR